MAGSINYTKLLEKLDPTPGGEDKARMRTGVISAVNTDGTVDLAISGIVVPDVPRLDGAIVPVGAAVNVIGYRGSLLVIGRTAINDNDAGSSLIVRADSVGGGSAIGTTEVNLISTADGTFPEGRAFRVSWRTRMTIGSPGIDNFRVRRDTPLSGTLVGSFQNTNMPAGLQVFQDTFYLKRTSAGSATLDLHLSLTHSVGSATPSGAADTVRYLEVYDVGAAADYANAVAI
jgi:hypothetical protein